MESFYLVSMTGSDKTKLHHSLAMIEAESELDASESVIRSLKHKIPDFVVDSIYIVPLEGINLTPDNFIVKSLRGDNLTASVDTVPYIPPDYDIDRLPD